MDYRTKFFCIIVRVLFDTDCLKEVVFVSDFPCPVYWFEIV